MEKGNKEDPERIHSTPKFVVKIVVTHMHMALIYLMQKFPNFQGEIHIRNCKKLPHPAYLCKICV